MTGLIHLFVLQVVIQGVLWKLKPRYANLFNHCYNKNVTVSASKNFSVLATVSAC
jgi:hypothetical protein